MKDSGWAILFIIAIVSLSCFAIAISIEGRNSNPTWEVLPDLSVEQLTHSLNNGGDRRWVYQEVIAQPDGRYTYVHYTYDEDPNKE